MTRDELRNELITPAGMAFFRTTISNHYLWLMHEAPFDRINTIRREGLQPKLPGGRVPDVVAGAIDGFTGIVCLNPNLSRHAQSSYAGLIFRVAVRASDLPARVGLDWSYPHNWDLRNVSEQQIHALGKDGAVLYVVDDTGCVASYDAIPPEVLRVCTIGKHGLFPSTWPLLSAVGNDEVQTVDRSPP
jgi:hypothetical protein